MNPWSTVGGIPSIPAGVRTESAAIADAVTEHARITAASRSADELERMGQVTHETRNMLNTAC